MLVASLHASALTPNNRTALFEALDKEELLELAESLDIPPTSFSDMRATAQSIASKHWKMLEIEIQIHIK